MELRIKDLWSASFGISPEIKALYIKACVKKGSPGEN